MCENIVKLKVLQQNLHERVYQGLTEQNNMKYIINYLHFKESNTVKQDTGGAILTKYEYDISKKVLFVQKGTNLDI